MVPTLGFAKDSLKQNGFINGYAINNLNDLKYENSIYLLFYPENLDLFKKFLDNEYERTEQIIEDFNCDNNHIVVIYSLDSEYKKDFNLVYKGKYSKTSDEFKNLFPQTVEINHLNFVKKEKSLQYRVFNRTQDLIDYWEDKLNVTFEENQEVWQIFNKEKETLNIKKLKHV